MSNYVILVKLLKLIYLFLMQQDAKLNIFLILLQDQRLALSVIQRNIRKWLTLRNWQWWKLYTRVKPLLSIARQEDEMKQAEENLIKAKEELEKLGKIKKELEVSGVRVGN